MDVERVHREVIEGKLLAALDDESKVAVICSAKDLRCIIYGLTGMHQDEHITALRDDLVRLHNEAFGE